MTTHYNRITGRSIERLAALSDGIFAVAMTLLMLDLHVPAPDTVRGEHELWQALVATAPQLATCLMSFLTLGIFWLGQQAQLQQFARGDRHLSWIHIGFLFGVSIMPFSTKLLGQFIRSRTALLMYWANILLLGVILASGWRCATRAGLIADDADGEVSKAIQRRILVAQALYAFGASLCVFNTYLSIGFIVLVQLNFVIAPRFRSPFRL